MEHKTAPEKDENAPVNINDAKELDYWTYKFQVTAERLKEAVAAVGTDADAVRQYLIGS